MAQALSASYPDTFRVEVADYMLALGQRYPEIQAFDQRHKTFWKTVLRRPLLARWGQRSFDALPKVTRTVHKWLLRPFADPIAEDMRKRAPALIVTNHPFLMTSFTLAQRVGGFPKVPVIHFATEPLDASALWADPDAQRMAVPSAAARRDLVRMGVAENRVDLVGYPVQQTFLNAPSQAPARCALGLEETFTCLLSLGGEGVSGGEQRTVRLVQALLEVGVQVVAVTGRNEALRRRLEGLVQAEGHKLVVHGFVDNMAEQLAACDLVVGKAGPASVLEALAVGRPVLVSSYAGLNERRLIRFLCEQRLGFYTPSVAQLVQEVRRYQRSPERLCEVTQRCAALGLPEMTEQVAHYLAGAATQGLAPERFEGRGLM